MYIKIQENNFGLFRTNNELLVFIAILRNLNDHAELTADEEDLAQMARISEGEVKKALTSLQKAGLCNVTLNGTLQVLRSRDWVCGTGSPHFKKPKDVKEENLDETERRFQIRMRERFPNVAKLKPITIAQYNKLLEQYPNEVIVDTLDAMNNYKPLCRRYKEGFATLRDWLKRRNGNGN